MGIVLTLYYETQLFKQLLTFCIRSNVSAFSVDDHADGTEYHNG